jgi:hypothetical protein
MIKLIFLLLLLEAWSDTGANGTGEVATLAVVAPNFFFVSFLLTSDTPIFQIWEHIITCDFLSPESFISSFLLELDWILAEGFN